MRDVQAQVIGVTSEQTKTGKTKFNINLSDGTTVTAWDLALATKAQQSIGQAVTLRIEDKPGRNPGVVYHNLKELALAGEQLSAVIPQAGTPIAPAATSTIPQAPPRYNGNGGGMSAEDKIRVTRLSCYSTAATLLSGAGDFEQLREVARQVYADVMNVPAPAAEAPVTPEAVAAALPAGTPIQVGTNGVTAETAGSGLPWS